VDTELVAAVVGIQTVFHHTPQGKRHFERCLLTPHYTSVVLLRSLQDGHSSSELAGSLDRLYKEHL
jgi:hypothetical protein